MNKKLVLLSIVASLFLLFISSFKQYNDWVEHAKFPFHSPSSDSLIASMKEELKLRLADTSGIKNVHYIRDLRYRINRIKEFSESNEPLVFEKKVQYLMKGIDTIPNIKKIVILDHFIIRPVQENSLFVFIQTNTSHTCHTNFNEVVEYNNPYSILLLDSFIAQIQKRKTIGNPYESPEDYFDLFMYTPQTTYAKTFYTINSQDLGSIKKLRKQARPYVINLMRSRGKVTHK